MKKNYLKRFYGCFSLLILTSTSCSTVDPINILTGELESPFPNEEISSHVNTSFQNFYNTCFNVSVSEKRNFLPNLTNSLISPFKTSDKPITFNQSINNVFTGVFSLSQTNEIVSGKSLNNSYPILKPSSKVPEVIDGTNSAIYKTTCSSYLNALLSAGIKANGNVDIAKLQGHFQASLNTDARNDSSVLLIKGDFISPLKKLLDENDLDTLFSVWDFYHNNETRDGNSYYLQRGFGLGLVNLNSKNSNTAFDSQMGASLGARVADFGDAQGQFKLDAGFQLKDDVYFNNQTSFFQSLTPESFQPYPNSSQLKSKIERNIDFEAPNAITIKQNQFPSTVPFKINISAPKSQCNKNNWSITNKSSNLFKQINVSDAQVNQSNKSFPCELSVNAEHDQNIKFTANLVSQNFELKYLKTNGVNEISKTKSVLVQFSDATISFVHVTSLAGNQNGTLDQSGKFVEFRYVLDLNDSENLIDRDALLNGGGSNPPGISISIPSSNLIDDAFPGIQISNKISDEASKNITFYQGVNNRFVLILTLPNSFYQENPQAIGSQINIELKVPLKAGNIKLPIKIKLPLTIKNPVVTETTKSAVSEILGFQ